MASSSVGAAGGAQDAELMRQLGKKGSAGLRRCACALCGPPARMLAFLRGLHARFGGFVVMAAAQYGVNQGVGEPTGELARKLYFQRVLKVDGADSMRYYASAKLPWNMKPAFGMLSDAMPLMGYRRTGYIVLAGACGVVAWNSLGLLPLQAASAVPFLVLMNLSMAVPDIMIDATTAELSRKHPEVASDLQALCWGALAVGGVYSCTTSGAIADAAGPQVLFLTTNLAALSVLIPGLLGWLGERRLPPSQRKVDFSWFRRHRPLAALAALMTVSASALTFLQVSVESARTRAGVTWATALVVVVAVWLCLKRVHRVLAKVALFLFAREALQPYVSDAFFQWATASPDGPQFSATFLGFVDCFAYLGLFAGVAIYNTKLTNVSYRRIFAFAQFALCLSNLMDLVLVMRWNLKIGIPDHAMLIGDTAMTACMRRFFTMPSFVLAAKVCPREVEATLFSMLMALSNFGTTIAELLGTSLLEALEVKGDNYDALPTAIGLKSLARLLPLALIPLLVPALTPNDPMEMERDGGGCSESFDAEDARLIDNEAADVELENGAAGMASVVPVQRIRSRAGSREAIELVER